MQNMSRVAKEKAAVVIRPVTDKLLFCMTGNSCVFFLNAELKADRSLMQITNVLIRLFGDISLLTRV